MIEKSAARCLEAITRGVPGLLKAAVLTGRRSSAVDSRPGGSLRRAPGWGT